MARPFYFGDYAFKPGAGLSCGGIEIHLPPRVQVLLLGLLEANGEVVTKDALHALIGAGGKASDAAQRQTISELRKALGDTKGDVVKTVFGRGLRLALPVRRTATPFARSGGGVTMAAQFAPHVATGEEMIRTAFELAAQRTDRQFQLAAAVLQNALERFPTLAIAPSLQADVETSRMIRGYVRAATHAPRALALVEKALSIQPGLPSALATKGWLMGVIHNDIPGGLHLIGIALAAAPQSWMTGFYKAWLLIGQRDLDAALATLDQALNTSPLERALLALKGYILWARGDQAEADRFIAEYIVLRPDVELLSIVQAMVLLQQGRQPEASVSMARAVDLYPKDMFVHAANAWFMAATERGTEAIDFLVRASRANASYVSPVHLAMIRRALGDTVAADNLLKIAEADRDPWRLLAWCDLRLKSC